MKLVRAPVRRRHQGVNFNLDGPPITLPSRAAQVLGMVIYELATNAAKYGALASDVGNIEVEVVTKLGRGEDAEITVLWRERGVEISTGTKPRGLWNGGG